MQLDKDTLLKQRFWILLGVVVPIILIVLIMLPTLAGSSTADAKAKVEQAENSLKLPDPKNQEWMKKLEGKAKTVTEQQKKVWGKAWDAQASLFTWPEDRQLDYIRNAYFGDPVFRDECSKYAGKRYDLAQAREILNIMQPVLPRSPRQVVLLRSTTNLWPLLVVRGFKREVPPSEEIWLAQEDLWVQRELMQIIRDANDSVAKFKVLPNFAAASIVGTGIYQPVKPETYWPAANKADRRQRFYNPYWELDLTLSQNAKKETTVRGTIHNISRRKLSLGITFEVQLTAERQAEDVGIGHIFVDGEPVATGKSVEIKELALQPQAVGRNPGLFGIEQVFTWKTAPVKRLDNLALFHSSHRNASATLKPARQFPVTAETRPADGGGPDAGNVNVNTPTVGVVGGAAPGPDAVGGAGGGGGSTAPVALRLTESGLVRDRYLHVTDQVRRMPVALTVTVDQNHIPNVIAAFSNSKLRMQVTQVHLIHVRGDTLRPPVEGSGTPGSPGEVLPGKPGPGPFGLPGGRDRGADDGGDIAGGIRPLPGAIGGVGGIGGPGSVPGMSPFLSQGEDEVDNLVELTVYAIASLYEKYPARPAAPASGSAAAGDGAPAKPNP